MHVETKNDRTAAVRVQCRLGTAERDRRLREKASEHQRLRLCSLTHAITGEKSEWKSCKDSIGVPIEYLHRDELNPELRRIVGNDLPCVAAEAGGETIVLLGSDVIARCRGSIPDFRGRLMTYAAMHNLRLHAPESVTVNAAGN